MTAKLKQLGADWDTLGKLDPLWAVISWPDKRGGKWDREEFYGLGREEVSRLLAAARATGLTLRRGRALDFGCGVGRLTEALAGHFDRVTGIDIAPSMVAYASENSRSDGRAEYILNDTGDLSRFGPGTFDCILSSITLQHVPSEFIPGYLREFVRVLAPGGVLIFQLPSHTAPTLRGLLWRLLPRPLVAALLRRKNNLPVAMQMNAIPRAEVERLLAAEGAKVAAVDRDTEAGSDWVSYRYIVTKPEA